MIWYCITVVAVTLVLLLLSSCVRPGPEAGYRATEAYGAEQFRRRNMALDNLYILARLPEGSTKRTRAQLLSEIEHLEAIVEPSARHYRSKKQRSGPRRMEAIK
jgi:hypothetical protein